MVERFINDGFVTLAAAVPRATVEQCTQLLWEQIGLDPHDRSGWTEPVRWVGGMTQQAFVDAMNTPALIAACDRLAGPGRGRRWAASRCVFRTRLKPDDAGWHVEGSYLPEGAMTWHLNLQSKDRALLALFLFTDVDDADGPTRIWVGSHRDIPALLEPYGERGVSGMRIGAQAAAASAHRHVTLATGHAGDVFVCHPFLVHAAQPNHGSRPRFLGQPCVPAAQPYRWDRPDEDCSPVEMTIKHALRTG
ncbi:MAG: phytanoyl-CoA dioxygenase family protein [Pseudonocardiaceae bacterium]